MKLEDILTLAKMGFTKEEILSIAQSSPKSNDPALEAQKNEETVPSTIDNTTAEKTKDQTNNDLTKALEPLMARMEAMENRMKLNNIIGTSINAQTAETAEDVLAKIINP